VAVPALKQVSPDAAPQAEARRRRAPWLQLGLAVLSGLLYVFAFPGLNQWYLAFISFVPVVWAAREATPRRALLLGAIVGLISHMIAYYWVVHMIQTFAFQPWIVGAFVWLVTCIGQGTSYGAGVALSQWLRRRTGWPYALTLAIGLVAMDFCYPLVFPSYIGNTMYRATWMMQGADLFGVLGLTALIGAINGALVDVLIARRGRRPWPIKPVGITAALWLGAIGYGAWRTAVVDREAGAAPKLKVGLVQANFGGLENLQDRDESLSAHRRLSHEVIARGADLVVWPEGALEQVVSVGSNIRGRLLPDETDPPILFGAVRQGPDPAAPRHVVPFNSAFLADATGRVVGAYDKTVLLVFGEYIPLGDVFPQLYEWIQNASHWGRGHSTAPLTLIDKEHGDWRLGTFICYEDILPRFVAQIMAPHGDRRPDVMINVTNDSWYGPYMEQEEHLALAVFRSVEHHRALVRDTNTGISAIIDPAGRVVSKTETFKEATLLGSVPKMSGTTLYELVGDVFGWASLAVLGGVWLQGRRRRIV
jgi:apolipoprotein N-acyltransferase